MKSGNRVFILGVAIVGIALIITGCPMPFSFSPASGGDAALSSNDPANPNITEPPVLLVTESTAGTPINADGPTINASRNVDIDLSSQTPGAAVFYTTDGSKPIPGDGTTMAYQAGSPIQIDSHLESKTIRAIAVAPSMYPSVSIQKTVSVTYDTVAAPVFSPAPGNYATDQLVSITSATAGATIYYTIADGTGGAPTPSPGAPGTVQYTGPVTVSGAGTAKSISAIAVKGEMIDSAVASGAYTVNFSQAATPVMSPNGAVVTTGTVTVTISTTTPDSTIWYTIDGSAPVAGGGGTTQSMDSGSSLTLTSDATVRAIASSASTLASEEVSASFIVTGFDPITRAQIAVMDGSMTSDDIDNSDGNRIPVGTIMYYVTDEGRYGKLLVKVSDASNNNGMTIDYVTYTAAGLVHGSGTNVIITGTWLLDLDQDNAVQSTGAAMDFWLVNQTDELRWLAPISPARFYVVP